MIPAGPNGELLGVLFVDSILMLCSSYSQEWLEKYPLKDPELLAVKASSCSDPSWVAWGNSQYEFINKTIAEWDANPYVIWRATMQHYPMFPLNYAMSNFASIVNVFLPILQAAKFDLYLCGHEHLLAYAEVDPAPAVAHNYHSLLLKAEVQEKSELAS